MRVKDRIEKGTNLNAMRTTSGRKKVKRTCANSLSMRSMIASSAARDIRPHEGLNARSPFCVLSVSTSRGDYEQPFLTVTV